MMGSSSSLSPLQLELLREFFRVEAGFFLTGGAALAGFYLGHRRTDDLDLFTPDGEAFERGGFALRAAAAALTATVVTRQEAPGFRRLVVSRGEESVVVDQVLDATAQLHPNKPTREGVKLDPPDEILVNKLTALVSRGEVRDLVDVMALERSGLRIEDALAAALAKDGGCTPATLAWVLSGIVIEDSARPPGGVPPSDLRDYLQGLIVRLRRAAFPR